MLLTGLFPVACSACFLIAPRTTCPGMKPPTGGWSPPQWNIHQENAPTDLPTKPANGRIFSFEVPSSQMTLPCVMLMASSISRNKTILTSKNQKAWLILESNTKDHGPETLILVSSNIIFQYSYFMMILWKQRKNDEKSRHSSTTLMERAGRLTTAKQEYLP